MDIQIIAGSVSTLVFVFSNFLMVYKAYTTSDLESYSLGNLIFSNLGNLVYWVYISSLPFGPIWFMHAYYTVITALMLFWYFRFRHVKKDRIFAKSQNMGFSKNTQFSSSIKPDKNKNISNIQHEILLSSSIIECLCGCLVSLWDKTKDGDRLKHDGLKWSVRFSRENLQQVS